MKRVNGSIAAAFFLAIAAPAHAEVKVCEPANVKAVITEVAVNIPGNNNNNNMLSIKINRADGTSSYYIANMLDYLNSAPKLNVLLTMSLTAFSSGSTVQIMVDTNANPQCEATQIFYDDANGAVSYRTGLLGIRLISQ